MSKVKQSPTGAQHKTPIEKTTRQGQGRRSKAKHGKLRRGQGKG